MSRRKRKKRRQQPGAPPGSITPDPAAPPPVLRVMCYSPDRVHELSPDVANLAGCIETAPVTWIDVSGTGDAEVIRTLGRVLELHPLALEDAAHVDQRPKVEAYNAHLFIVARMLRMQGEHLNSEQLSIFLGKRYVLTVQEGTPGDPFDPVRERIRKNIGAIRSSGADYLAYSLLDAVIDAYFPVLEDFGERLEQIEACILARPTREAMAQLYETKRELLRMRRAVWPLREALNTLVRDTSPLITAETRIHLRDCYDHAVRIIDFLETDRELASDLADVYLSSASNRLNEVMKVLTIIATIFIPLTFISGLYGMNFNPAASPWNMPELNWYWGYPFALTLMAVTATLLVIYFWGKGWLGPSTSDKSTDNEPR